MINMFDGENQDPAATPTEGETPAQPAGDQPAA